MAKLQESRAETLVGEDENSLTQSNMLVSNLQAGTSLGHPNSVLIDEFNEKQADGIEEVTRTQYEESSNPMANSNKESENSLANTNETWMSKENGPVVMDHQNRIQSQLVQVQTSGTNTLHMETYDSVTNLETHCTSLPNSSYLKQSTMEIDSNTNKEFSHRDSGENNYKRSFASLFTKLTRGPSTYSTYSVRNQITTKNSRAAIFEIRTLINLSMNEIAVVLNKCIGNDIIGIKPHFTKGVRTHLEIIFKSREDVQKYCANGINMFNQTFLGYIPTNSRNSYLSIKLKNVPIDFQDDITKEIRETFDHVGKISSIKPLVFEGTSILSNQWVVIFDITDDPDINKRIPRFITIMDQKVTTEWREAPKLCFFCDAEGHIKRECQQYKEAQKLKAEYRKYKNNKIALSESSAFYNSTDLSNNTFINSEQTVENNCTNIQDHLSQEEIVVTQVQQNNSILTSNQQEESSDLDDIEIDTHMEDLETLLQEEKDQEVSIQDSNKVANKNIDNTQQDTEFTLVSNVKKKKKKSKSNNNTVRSNNRSVPYTSRNTVQSQSPAKQ